MRIFVRRSICFFICAAILAACILAFRPQETSGKNISGVEYEDISVEPTRKGDGFSTVLYDNKNGLPTSEANAIVETKEGFIWIGSYSGLIRYDGNTFERMDSTGGISSVVCLYADSKDRLWIGTNDNGVAVMDKGVFTYYDTDDGLGSSSVRCITEDKEGTIYIASTLGLNTIGQDMVLKRFDEKQLNNEYICELRTSESDVIYGETLDGDIFTLENGELTGFYGSGSLFKGGMLEERNFVVYSVFPDPDKDGYVYIGTENSCIVHGKLDGELHDAEVIDVSPLSCIASIEKFKDQIWVCADNGIGLIDSDGFYMLDDVPMNNSVEHTLVDYEGNLWFTSSRQGVMKIVPNQFKNIFEAYGLGTAVVNSTCIYQNMLFVATDTGLIVLNNEKVLDNLNVTFADANDKFAEETNLIKLLNGARIRSIIKDSKNRLWFSTYTNKGLVVYDNGVITRFDSDNGLPSNKVRTIYEKQDGSIMVACSGGLAIIKDGKVDRIYNEESGLNNMEVLTVSEAENGDMVIGTDGNGIYVIKGQKVTNLGKKDGLNSEVVMRIKYDKTRKLFWIVTSNSLAFMTEDYKITSIKKFPYSNNFDMYENSLGKMWILSSNGIYVVSAKELLDNKEINPVFFSMANGLPCVATANSYSAMNSDGVLYIAGTTGVAKINIEEAKINVDKIKMAVPYVEADGVIIYPDAKGRFNIPSDANRLTIHSFVYTYSLINPKVTYWLDGFDQEFQTVDRSDLEPSVYTNLEGGTYHFMMILQDALGVGNKQLDVTIVKKKSFFEQSWFKLLIVVGIIGLAAFVVAVIVRRKTRALSKKNEQNRIFINEITQAFAKTIDMKDKYTNGHSQRVAEYTAMLTKELGYDDEIVEKYRNIALLHDIGKISVPPEVLNKDGKLSDQEFNLIKSHSAKGYMALKDISIMPELAIGAGQHHERPDGKGYPKGLKGDEIARVAQIIAVADTFDAMYSDRPYRKRMNFEKAVSIIKEVSGTQLTADVVDAFLRIVDRGGLRAEDDFGGGSLEDIDNIHKKQNKE